MDLFFNRDWAGFEGAADADVAMAGAVGLLKSVAPAGAVGGALAGAGEDAAGWPNSPPPKDGVVLDGAVVVVEAGADVVAGAVLKGLEVGAADVVDVGGADLSAPAVPKRLGVVVAVVVEGGVAVALVLVLLLLMVLPPKGLGDGAVVVVGVDTAGLPPKRGFVAPPPAPPKREGAVVAAVVGAVVDEGAAQIWLASAQV